MNEILIYEGDDVILELFEGATLEEGDLVCEACLFEVLQEASCGCPNLMGISAELRPELCRYHNESSTISYNT